MFDRQLAWH